MANKKDKQEEERQKKARERFENLVAKRQIMTLYTTSIRKYGLDKSRGGGYILSPVWEIANNTESPKEFHVELLKMLINSGEKQLIVELEKIKTELIQIKENEVGTPAELKAIEYKKLAEEIDADLEGRYQLRKQIVMRFKDRVNEVQSLVELDDITKEEGDDLVEAARRDAKKKLDEIENL